MENSMMDRVCEKMPSRFLRVPLKSTEQIYLIFLIPTLIHCAVYIVHFSADFVVVEQHFRENNPIWGCCTIVFMYSPAIVYFVLTVSRPDWWMTDDDKLQKGVFVWFCIQLCHLFGFVFFALYRYATLVVLSIDAILRTGKERSDALNAAASPAAIELYFFLQAWFQAAPQAIFQTHLLFHESSVTNSHQSAIVKVLSILMSVTILAIQTASFQRFESQRVNGRTLPWATWLRKHRTQEATRDVEEKIPLKPPEGNENVASTGTTEQRESAVDEETGNAGTGGADERAESPTLQASVTPPLPPKNIQVVPPPTPLRGITTVPPLPIPDVPAPPRPDTAPSRAKFESDEPRVSTPKSGSINSLDTRIENANNGGGSYDLKIPKRQYATKGLEEDDPAGKFLTFLWWFLFILARVLALVLFYHFYSLYSFIVIGIHYGFVSMYLFHHTKFCNAITFFLDLWLGSVYIISLIEYRVKFKYADKWVLSYYVFVLTQNTLMTLTWYIYADWTGFWYTYVFYIIFGSMTLCVLSTAFYYALLKPKKHRIYAERGKT